MPATTAAKPPAFAALRLRGYRAHFITYVLAMMADNIEHVISYWVAFQKFHSPALGGFAVLSHWLPFLAFSVSVGALNDRFDSRRIIQAGMVLFMTASIGWGYFFATNSLTPGAAMVLLVVHGCAGVLWQTSSQMLLHDIVDAPTLASAVRLNATARYLGILVGPAVGGLIMLTLGPTRGIFSTRSSTCRCSSGWCARPTAVTSAATNLRPGAPCAASPTSSRPCVTSAACRSSRP
jgi:MFS family permease